MKACYLDVATSGHHRSFLDGLASATCRAGIEVVVASPDRHRSPEVGWVRAVTRDRIQDGRRQFREVSRYCRENQVDMFFDLNFDNNAWLIPRDLNKIRFRAHVLHHANQYLFEGRSGSGKLRTAVLRAHVRRLTADGALIVVHTPRAAEALKAVVSTRSILQIGYPIGPEWITGNLPQTKPEGADSVILFVGRARREKGLLDLLDAVSRLPNPTELKVVGPQDPELIHTVQRTHPSVDIEWTNRLVSDRELAALYTRSSLVAVPYQNSFRHHGGASGVLLQALAQGKPVIATDAVADQLPAGYAGAVVVPANSVSALTEGVEHTLRILDQLATAAAEDGPAFVGEYHTFEAYVAALTAGASGNA